MYKIRKKRYKILIVNKNQYQIEYNLSIDNKVDIYGY